jgi:hypothetical protein
MTPSAATAVRSFPISFPVAPSAELLPRLPRFESAFRAVENALRTLEIDRPHELRSPAALEEALDGSSALEGTLVLVDPAELRTAELDLEETVADERGGGTFFVSVPTLGELSAHRVRYRDLGSASTGFAFLDEAVHPVGFGKFHFVRKPDGLRRWRILVADTPGFRVALVSRPLPGGGFIGLWTGNPDLVDEVSAMLRRAAEAAGHQVPPAGAPVPPFLGVEDEADVWRQAAVLRGQREIREGELREIARAAALRGVELRRQRAIAAAAHGKAKAPAA